MMKSKKSIFIEGHILSNSCHGQVGQSFCIHRARFNNGKYAIIREASGICSSLAKLFNETIASGFITLPKFAFSHLSTLKMMNPEDNFLNIDNKFMRIMTAYFGGFTIPF